MPKVKRNTNLSRVARRRIATSVDLHTSIEGTKKKSGEEDNFSIEVSGYTTLSSSIQKEKKNSESKTKNKNENDGVKNAIDDKNKSVMDIRQTQLSRGQRKRQAKREQFLKKEKMILSSLMLKRHEEQKQRIDGLDAIKQALMDTSVKNTNDQSLANTGIKPVHHIVTNKAKRKLVSKEIEHVNLILQHPAFKQDPFETMQEHLRNTFSEDRKQQELLSKKRTDEDKQKMEARRSEKLGIKKKSQKKKYKPRRTR